jgi:deoxyribonuclease I
MSSSRHSVLILVSFLLLPLVAQARHPFYPETFRTLVAQAQAGEIDAQTLSRQTFLVLHSYRLQVEGEPDRLGCDHPGVEGRCYRHEALSYEDARRALFGKIHLEKINGRYVVEDIYCLKNYDQRHGVGPDQIPNHQEINTEHVWPQSKFSTRFPSHLQRADLHHLYPSESRANGVRANFPFYEVDGEKLNGCEASRIGDSLTTSRPTRGFEPPDESKGNIARAVLYFSVRYQLPLPQSELEVLRRWHELDPVDDKEAARNETIYELQGNRNPFIDYPELVELLAS